MCGRRRECNFAATSHPVCPSCSPKATAPCARCGQDRPPAGPLARRPGLRPVLHRRAAAPGTVRVLRPAAAAGHPARPGRRHLRRLRRAPRHPRLRRLRDRGQALRARPLRPVQPAAPGHGAAGRARWPGPGRADAGARGDLRGPQPRDRRSTGCAAATAPRCSPTWPPGTLPATHQALDAHPRRRAADFLRHMLTAGGVLAAPRRGTHPHRAVARPASCSTVEPAAARRLVRGLRHLAGDAPAARQRRTRRPAAHLHRPRPAQHPRRRRASSTWLHGRGRALAAVHARPTSTSWLATGPAACQVRDFLSWAARHGHCPGLRPSPARRAPAAPPPARTSAGRWPPGCCTTTPSTPPTGPPDACCCSTASSCPGSPP